MAVATESWDYCQIDVQIVDDGRSFARGGPGNKLMWFCFLARAAGPNGDYIASRTDKVPLANMLGATLSPDATNIGHQNVLQTFLEKLQAEGWVLESQKGGEWWERRLRRPASANKLRRWKLTDLLLIVAAIVALIWLGWLAFGLFTSPFPRGVAAYLDQPITVSTNAPYRVGKILPVNVDTRQIDPIYDQLPAALQARNPDEVGTVIRIDCDVDANWRRSTSDCMLSVIDFDKLTAVGQSTIVGTAVGPPASQSSSYNDGGQFELRDTEAILAYITNLPALQ